MYKNQKNYLKEVFLLAEILTGVNGKIIKWAREYYNMTTEEAANAGFLNE